MITVSEQTELDNMNDITNPKLRRLYLGGVDAGKLMRANRYPNCKPYNVFQEKTGIVDPPNLDDNDAVLFGKLLEGTVADVYVERTGNKVRRINRTLVHPEHDFIRGHIDRKLENKNAGLEVKTVGLRTAYEWGLEGTDQIPLNYLYQVLHYLAITGYDYFDIAALFYGQEFRLYKVRREDHEEKIAELIERERKFWMEHIEPDIPPMPETGDEAYAAYPDSDPDEIAYLDDSKKHLVTVCHNLAEDIKEKKEKLDQVQTELKNEMGEAEVLEDSAGFQVCTWKSSSTTRLDTKKLLQERPELKDEFPSVSTSRTFRLKRRRDDE